MKVNIDYKVKAKSSFEREFVRPWVYAGRHFTQACKTLKQQMASNKTSAAAGPILQSYEKRFVREALFDFMCHSVLALVELLPCINHIFAIADRHFLKKIPLINGDKPDAELRTDAIIRSNAQLMNTQKITDDIYDIFEVTHDILTKNNIPYCLSAGSQLGATRHKGLIPWDDDGDVATPYEYKNKILSLKKEFEKRGCEIKWATDLYGIIMVYKKDGKQQLFNKYPAVDITLVDDLGSCYEYSGWVTHYKFGKEERITKEQWKNVTDVPFGHLTLKGLVDQDAKDYLFNAYGKRCLTTAVKTHSHSSSINRDEANQELVRMENFEPARHSKNDPNFKGE